MKDAGLLPVTGSTPFVMLNVEQFRQDIRQEFLSVINQNAPAEDELLIGKNQPADREYLTVSEAAKLTTLAVSAIRLYIRRGKLKAARVGKRLVISRAELDRFLIAGSS